jgi:hypothetical protein
VDSIFAWIEGSVPSELIRESPTIFAYPTIITLHTIGMGFLAGTNAAIDLRILGVARRIPLKPMEKFLPILWWALVVNVISGLLLLMAYPTKALTNPIFYLKLSLIVLALVVLRMLRFEVFRAPDVDQQQPPGRRAMVLAAASLCLWIGAITAGRLLAYTYTWEMVGVRAVL